MNSGVSREALGPRVSCIVGPTAAGKSALAMVLAEQRGLSIVSADSRQVYQGFDIGTAKPSAEEQARVTHFGIDVIPPTTRYSAHRWATEAVAWSAQATASGAPPLVVGGTGLYLRALLTPLDAVPVLDEAHRAQLTPWLMTLTSEELGRWCARLDASRAPLGRTQRLRAVETALLTGQRLSDAFSPAVQAPSVRARYLVVDPGSVLATRIADRVHAMLRAGFVEEIERLLTLVPPDAPAWQASGYGVLREAVEGRRRHGEAVERVIIETRQYAKRQRTWFRHQLPSDQVTHIDPTRDDAIDQLLAWWDMGLDDGVTP